MQGHPAPFVGLSPTARPFAPRPSPVWSMRPSYFLNIIKEKDIDQSWLDAPGRDCCCDLNLLRSTPYASTGLLPSLFVSRMSGAAGPH